MPCSRPAGPSPRSSRPSGSARPCSYWGFNRWRNQYGGMKAEETRRLKELEIENARLKRAVADLTVDNQILKEANNILGKLDRPHDGGLS